LTSVPVTEVGCVLCGETRIQATVCKTKDFCYETCDNEFEYVKCLSCSHVYLKNRPLIEALETIYPSTYLTYDYEQHLGGFINRLRNMVQKAKLQPVSKYARQNDVIIDVGSGAGDFLALAKKFGDPTWTLVGVDFSDRAIEGLRSRGLEDIQGRFETCDYDYDPAGVIIMNQLIEHVEDPVASLQKSFEILRPGGALIIETPNLRAWDPRIFRRRYWGCWHAPRHWNLFDAESLSGVARRVGFEVVQVKYTLNPFAWLHSVQYLLRDRFGWERIGRKFDVDNFLLLCGASGLDIIQKILTGRTSNMRLVVVKPH